MTSAEKKITGDNILTVDESMKDEDHDSHLHVSPPILSGNDRLYSVLLSDYVKGDSEVLSKRAMYMMR